MIELVDSGTFVSVNGSQNPVELSSLGEVDPKRPNYLLHRRRISSPQHYSKSTKQTLGLRDFGLPLYSAYLYRIENSWSIPTPESLRGLGA